MTEVDNRAIKCPHCGYDLRGQTVPRCPECGQQFSADAWRAGLLRQRVPGALDGADPWQPHQVLWGALRDLTTGLLWPWGLVHRIDLDGRLTPAMLMLLVGAAWIYAMDCALLALAGVLHTGASPAAALEVAALDLAPRLLGLVLASAPLVLVAVGQPRRLNLVKAQPRHYLRLFGFWFPTLLGYITLACAALLIVLPGLWPAGRYSIPVLAGFFALQANTWTGAHRRTRGDGLRALGYLAFMLLWLLALLLLAGWMLPDQLAVPDWAVI